MNVNGSLFVRSIAHKPLLLLADEPTSALDPHHSEILFHLMLSLAKQQKIAVLLVLMIGI